MSTRLLERYDLSCGNPGRQIRDGFTLVELVVSVAIGSIALGFFATVLLGSTRSLEYAVKDAQTVHDVDRLATLLRRDLASSAPSKATITTASVDGDRVDFQQSRSTGSGTVEWGVTASGGTWLANGWLRYAVLSGNVERLVLDATGTVVGNEVIVRGVSTGTEKGLTATFAGPLLRITIRSRQTLDDGNEIVRDWNTAIALEEL